MFDSFSTQSFHPQYQQAVLLPHQQHVTPPPYILVDQFGRQFLSGRETVMMNQESQFQSSATTPSHFQSKVAH
jgi:hypothetical protein